MSWKDKQHITRIFNSFKRNKTNIYPEDINALKSLDELINDNSKTMTAGNLIFAKLLCLYLRQNAFAHKGVKGVIYALKKELKSPLEHNLWLLTKELNNIDLELYAESKGVNIRNWESIQAFKKEDNQEMINKILNGWTVGIVEKSFYSTANDLLKDIENYT